VGVASGGSRRMRRTRPAGGIDAAVAVVLVVVTSIVVARRLVQHPAVNASTIAGALCIHLLVGLFFAFLFGFTEKVGLNPFFVSTAHATDVDYLYFSFSTLATVGLATWWQAPTWGACWP